MESVWLAETPRYLYLLFSPRDFLPLNDMVFHTDAHVLGVAADAASLKPPAGHADIRDFSY
ncbi:hypothetical protein BJY01DRAFT_227664 [Aspergillus pseudoustus]|uniref:Class I alpha-mannosidase 1B n=1 Tax=Aspergillus pseudoustus TaxID=1810923 RepID=A0ABR4IQ17_9EURO